MKQESLDELVTLIHKWGEDRNMYKNSTPQAQALKLVSEVGELCDNLAKGRYECAEDDIGDCFVVLVHIARMIHSDMGKCVDVAYRDIKDRKGHFSPQGIFVKEGDV